MTDLQVIRTSERAMYSRCRKAWEWAYIDKLRPRSPAPALRFGLLAHRALEARYPVGVKRGPHPAAIFERLYNEELEALGPFGSVEEDGTWADALELGVGMLNNFVETFGDDGEYEVLATEHRFQTPLRSRGRTIGYYVGRLDGVWKHKATGRVLLIDWKTTDRIESKYLQLDEQAGAYLAYGVPWLRAKGIIPKEQVSWILYTFLRKAKPDQRPRNALGQYLNKNGAVSEKQPAPYFERVPVYRDPIDQANLRRRVFTQFLELQVMKEERNQPLIYKSPGRFSCMGCGFFDMCEVHEAGGDWETLKRGVMETWDPYSYDEIDQEGR